MVNTDEIHECAVCCSVQAWRLGDNCTTRRWMRDPITTTGCQSCSILRLSCHLASLDGRMPFTRRKRRKQIQHRIPRKTKDPGSEYCSSVTWDGLNSPIETGCLAPFRGRRHAIILERRRQRMLKLLCNGKVLPEAGVRHSYSSHGVGCHPRGAADER
ncbi:hypothetical protein VTK26DRAFT_3005 [Humicola hyalothermophila]